MRTLDVGCGTGRLYSLAEGNSYIGIDIDAEAIKIAVSRDYPNATFIVKSADQIREFKESYFDRVVSGVSLCYMNIPNVLEQCFYVLKSGGELWLELHSWRMTLSHLWISIKKRDGIKPVIMNCYALLNGLYFHLTGRVFHFPFYPDKFESFQTGRGMRLALGKAGFSTAKCYRQGYKLIVEAKK